MLTLAPELQPTPVTIDLGDSSLVETVEQELKKKALIDPDQCFGYFPAMQVEGIYSDLPASQAFEATIPWLRVNELDLGFNFLRMSLVEQKASASFHLDSDAATALTGDLDSVGERHVWRLLLNLSPDHNRYLSYVAIDPFKLPLTKRQNYIYCPDVAIPRDKIRTTPIPSRLQHIAHGVLFCSSQVLHSGQDDENGHFVAAYGRE